MESSLASQLPYMGFVMACGLPYRMVDQTSFISIYRSLKILIALLLPQSLLPNPRLKERKQMPFLYGSTSTAHCENMCGMVYALLHNTHTHTYVHENIYSSEGIKLWQHDLIFTQLLLQAGNVSVSQKTKGKMSLN